MAITGQKTGGSGHWFKNSLSHLARASIILWKYFLKKVNNDDAKCVPREGVVKMCWRFNKCSEVTFGISAWQNWKWKPVKAFKKHKIHNISKTLSCAKYCERSQHMIDLHSAVSQSSTDERSSYSSFAAIAKFRLHEKFMVCSFWCLLHKWCSFAWIITIITKSFTNAIRSGNS